MLYREALFCFLFSVFQCPVSIHMSIHMCLYTDRYTLQRGRYCPFNNSGHSHDLHFVSLPPSFLWWLHSYASPTTPGRLHHCHISSLETILCPEAFPLVVSSSGNCSSCTHSISNASSWGRLPASNPITILWARTLFCLSIPTALCSEYHLLSIYYKLSLVLESGNKWQI